MVWIVRTFRNEKNSDFQYNKYFDDHEFKTKDDAVNYRKTLKDELVINSSFCIAICITKCYNCCIFQRKV